MTPILKPQKQLIAGYDPANGIWGDCYRTCLAVVLGLDALEVPHFMGQEDAGEKVRNWLGVRNLGLFNAMMQGNENFENVLAVSYRYNPGIPLIITGKSPRHAVGHSVVVMDGVVICDPCTGKAAGLEALDGPAINGDEAFWWLEAIIHLP